MAFRYEGTYREVLNTERDSFGGTWTQNNQDQQTEAIPFKEYPYQIKTILPALGALIIKPEKIQIKRRKKMKGEELARKSIEVTT